MNLQKQCSKCGETKPASEFYKEPKVKSGLASRCKQCERARSKATHKRKMDEDPEGYRLVKQERVNKAREKTRVLKEEAKAGGCQICGYNRCPEALEFHHVDETTKDYNPSRLATQGSRDKFLDEIKKCVIVCANCHREIHAGVVESPQIS